MRTFPVSAIIALLLVTTLTACGKSNAPDEELGIVIGTVTLDDQPLEGAQITFTPLQRGAMSYAMTDAEGKFNLLYSPGVPGAVLGTHEVRISKVGGPETNFDTLEMLPEEYNAKSTLTAEVKSGENKFDYAIKSHSPKQK